ncbi:MAG: hypothetical protein E5X43_09715 [Mesorhizobium sp.]|nr:MAG: hypothetical protein E5X43_09715 [Mesorhizobium sp.]
MTGEPVKKKLIPGTGVTPIWSIAWVNAVALAIQATGIEVNPNPLEPRATARSDRAARWKRRKADP